LPVPMVSLGRLKGDEALARAYNCADIVVVPSIEDNLPNVALEAIACGVPVAAFDVGGMSDIVTDGWNGRLASMSDSESLGSVLVEMIRDPKMLEVMSMNARKRDFPLATRVKLMLHYLSKLLPKGVIKPLDLQGVRPLFRMDHWNILWVIVCVLYPSLNGRLFIVVNKVR